MNERASNVGYLAARALSKGGSSEVTRVFQSSAYLRSGDDFTLLLWGKLRSPMTINLEGGYRPDRRMKVGERCTLHQDAITFDAGEITVRGATMFRSGLLRSRQVKLPEGSALAKGVAMLRSLYDVSSPGPTLATDPALSLFVRETLSPLAAGDTAGVHSPSRYLPLIGRGGGFTPAGDDFVGGLVATFNYVARCRRSRQVMIPRALIRGKTVPESAAILGYSIRGHVDEGMERLVLASTEGAAGFYDELMTVARRGHTSGIDMSLGAMLCEAALAQEEGERDALQMCLDALWKP